MKKYVIFVILSVLMLASSGGLQASTSNEQRATSDDIVTRALDGQELIFARRYDDAMKAFDALIKDHPESPAGYFGKMALLEMRMLEREDFHLEVEFEAVTKAGMVQVKEILGSYHPEAWDLFLAGSLLGLDGFLKARKGKWLDAYVAGTKSRQIFHRVKQMDPKFVDADFGLGMYIFWRSVFARDLWFLKMLPDRRQEGIRIVESVANQGRFAKQLARVNLAIMYFEEKRFDDAEKVLNDYVLKYPSNVILRTLLGKAMIVQKRYAKAIEQFKAIIVIDPTLTKPHYFLGAAYVLAGDAARFGDAEKELKGFIDKEPQGYWKASAHYWLAKLEEKRGDNKKAKLEYEEVLKINPKAMEALKKVRALGGGL